MMFVSTSLVSCNFKLQFDYNFSSITPIPNPNSFIVARKSKPSTYSKFPKSSNMKTGFSLVQKRPHLQTRPNSFETQNSETQAESKSEPDSGNGGGDERDWTTSLLLFGLWVGLMYYVFNLSPNQTPSTDMYFLKKLLNLIGDDGFRMNQVLVSLWYMMGLWPLVYSMLLIPTARSSKGNPPVWPFVTLSVFGGVYVLLPYFVLWKPPPPPVEQTELKKWPLNFLESKLTARVVVGAGLGLITYAGFAGTDAWKEFYQYFRQSKFIHAMSIDFSLLSAFAPFWVYNDMSVRKCERKMSWLLPLSAVPLLGPALYLLLRPSISAIPVVETQEDEI